MSLFCYKAVSEKCKMDGTLNLSREIELGSSSSIMEPCCETIQFFYVTGKAYYYRTLLWCRMVEAKEKNLTPSNFSDMQAVLKRCENLEKEVRSLKLNLSFMNR